MANPDLLQPNYRSEYETLIGIGMDPEEAFNSVMARQQASIDAQKTLTEEATIERQIKEDPTQLPPEILDVLDIERPGETFAPFSQFLPGFQPEVVPAESQRALPPAITSLRNRNVYDPQRIPMMEAKAVADLTDYYVQQGFPTYEQAQFDAVQKFADEYGTREQFIANDPLGLGDGAGQRYDLMFRFAQKPPTGFTNTAEQKAYEQIKGDPADPSVMGRLDRPAQPKRFAQYGDMEKVGPRSTNIMQGASPMAEDLRQQPELAREMSTSRLAAEAFRPQIIKSGEQVRQEKAAQKPLRDALLNAQGQLMEQEKMNEEEAFNALVDQMKEQAKVQLRMNLENRVTPKMLLDYHTGSITAMGRLGMMPSQEEIFEDMLETMATNAVLTEYRKAGLYEYATKYDKLKGGRTYGTRGMTALEDAFKYLTEDEYGSNYIQNLKEAGRIDVDAITETTPMQYARNLNFVFRLGINPVMDVFGETIDTVQEIPDYLFDTNFNSEEAMRTGSAEARFAERYGQGLTSPTVELTDDAGYNPINVMDAYLKEVLVETATGRTLGNDIVSFHPDRYYEMMQEDATNPDEIPFFGDPDTFVVGGTLFEVMLPLEAPIIAMQKGVTGASKLPRNWRLYSAMGKELKAAELGDAAPPSLMTKLNAFEDSSKISSHVADDAADVILAAERVEDLGTIHKGDAAAEDIMKMGLGARGKGVVDELMTEIDPSAAAKTKIDNLADPSMSKKTPALHTAAKDSVSRRAAYGKDPQKGTRSRADKRKQGMNKRLQEVDVRPLDTVAETLAHESMKGKVAADLDGFFGLGDYHLLTERVAVSRKFLDNKIDDQPIMAVLADDVEGQLGKLAPEASGPRVIKDDYFSANKANSKGIDIGDGELMADGAEVNYARLFQVDRTKDPYLDQIIQNVKNGDPITYAQDVYLRQRVLEKMAGARAEKFKTVGYGDELIKVGEGTDFRPVVEGTEFQKQVMVPDERRLGTARTINEAYSAVTPRAVRDGLKTFKENITSPIKTLDDLGQPIDARVARMQEAQTEAVVSLQRQTPIVARKLYKETGSNAETVDVMFIDAVEGRDYTRLIKQGMTYTDEQAKGLWKGGENVVIVDFDGGINSTVDAFYETLLGPSFKLQENKIAFRQAIDNLDVDPVDIFENQTIANILGEMQRINSNALATAAVDTRLPIRSRNVKVTDVDIGGAKLAFATDTTRGIRTQKVISELVPEGNINLTYYAEEMTRRGKAMYTPGDAQMAIQVATQEILDGTLNPGAYTALGIKGPEIRSVRAAVARPAEQFADYIRGIRAQGKSLGYSDDLIEEAMFDSMTLYRTEGDMATFGAKQDELVKLIYDPETNKGVVRNLTRLRRAAPTDADYLKQIYDYNIALRKRLVSGQLGGLVLPNAIYHAENFATAPMIASITAPDFVGTVMGQQARAVKKVSTAKMPAVADDVLQGEAGLTRFVTSTTEDGTPMIGRYTVEEAIDLYRTKNLGSTQSSLHLDDNFIRDVQALAGKYGIGDEVLKGTLTG